ncbi:hypothetical protein P3X46_008355 [Hevea brasiliensis]|uniref:VQ domain-containing protein n=1 Tax=Hevea brasiliensis TaxID=3981 RepID=A0ABQ9MIA7_HEVBR|nr:hypothetical protein P3X46_008355 [Hevea brasiliensis]
MGKLSKQCCQLLHRPKSKKLSKNKKKPVKITYICNPTMVRAANASEFRAIVQELTGKDSKIINTWDPCTTSNEEATQVLSNSETSPLTMNSESADDIFSHYASSSSTLEMEDSFFWKDLSESFFEFQSSFVFV